MEKEEIAKKPLKPSDDTYDHNTGVEFYGESLELHRDQALESLQVSIHDALVVEIALTGQFIFKYERSPQVWHGKCDYCYHHKVLRLQCACKQVKYCRAECMKNDERFHADKCTA